MKLTAFHFVAITILIIIVFAVIFRNSQLDIKEVASIGLFGAAIAYLINRGNAAESYTGGGGAILEPVSKSNIKELLTIEVLPEQLKCVASISDSLIQASFLENWHGYAYRAGGKIVGFGSFADYSKQPNAVKIYKIMIDKNQQGKGYGKSLLEKLIAEIKKQTSKDIYIDVHTDCAAALSLYKKYFNIIEEIEGITIMKLMN